MRERQSVAKLGRHGATDTNGPNAFVLGVPYFFVASSDSSTVTNFLLLRLDTGQTVTQGCDGFRTGCL